MADKVQENIRAIERARALRIKQEPIDYEEEHHPTQENFNIRRHEKSNSTHNDPRINSPVSHGINEAMRRNFLAGNLNIQNVLNETTASSNHHHNLDKRIRSIYDRALNVRDTLATENATVFYGLVPPHLEKYNHLKIPHASPVAQNLHNSIFACQTSSETIGEVAKNPYASISFDTQCIAKKIGANLDDMMPKTSNNKTPVNRNPIISPRPTPPIIIPATPEVTRVASIKTTSISTQTISNSGSFLLEIPSKDLMNLTNKQKELLLQVMKEFNVKDSKNSMDMLERLEHRQGLLEESRNIRRERSDIRSSGPPLY